MDVLKNIILPMPGITGVIGSSLSATTAKVVSSVSSYFLPIRIKFHQPVLALTLT